MSMSDGYYWWRWRVDVGKRGLPAHRMWMIAHVETFKRQVVSVLGSEYWFPIDEAHDVGEFGPRIPSPDEGTVKP